MQVTEIELGSFVVTFWARLSVYTLEQESSGAFVATFGAANESVYDALQALARELFKDGAACDASGGASSNGGAVAGLKPSTRIA